MSPRVWHAHGFSKRIIRHIKVGEQFVYGLELCVDLKLHVHRSVGDAFGWELRTGVLSANFAEVPRVLGQQCFAIFGLLLGGLLAQRVNWSEVDGIGT
ncbi:MAG: hypothetical protein WD425_11065 [Nitrospirales bacterium]